MSDSHSQFTAWVTDANQDDRHTIYVTEVTARSAREAMLQAIEECAAEWEVDPRTLVCLGVAEGSVTILAWDDAGYTHKELALLIEPREPGNRRGKTVMTEQQMNDQWAFVQTEPMESAIITDSEGFTVGYIVGAGMDPKKSAAELAERVVQEHNSAREARASGFHVGQRVKKVTGDYQITGEVRGIFTKANGVVRLVVEHQAEGGGSFLHVYGPNNLVPLDDDQPE